MSDATDKTDAPKSEAPVLEGGTYEIIQRRLRDRAGELRERLAKLNTLRKDVFGSVETALLRADRITTEHNCVPRDMAPVGHDTFLFGYNVQFGLKTSVQLSDVFAVYKYHDEHFQETDLKLIENAQFQQDFQSLYKYYKNTRFVKFSFIGTFLFMVFRVGREVADVKTFKWHVEGDRLVYVDNRSDHEFRYPAQYEFDWKRTHRELHRSGIHPHISIDDRVFVECVSGDLTIKIEDNTETGEGIYSEPVDFKDQTLDDAEIHYAICGNLVMLKIRPFQEKAFRYFVFNDKIKQVQRVDGIAQACVTLPEDQGVIFSNGFYLQTGVLKLFEAEKTDMMFERVVTSSNGEDYLYVFYNRLDGDYVLLPYNLIRQQVDTPIWCHGFSLFENGELVYFKSHSNPEKHHTLQVWQTPFVASGFERHENTNNFLYKIGNREVVRCMAECQDVLNLISKDESYEGLYIDIVKTANDIADGYFWIDNEGAFNLKETLLAIREASSQAIDEHQKVVRIRQETNGELRRVKGAATELFGKVSREERESIDAFVELLASLRTVRGETISLKELRYVDLKQVEALEHSIGETMDQLSRECVEYLLKPEALNPYRDRVAEHEAAIDGLEKVASARELEEEVAGTGEQLELLIEIVTNLKIADATETTRIIDGITSIYTTLNQVKAALKNRIRSLMQTEGAAQFGAELKLLNQSVINYLDICDTPARCEEYLNKVMVQFEELEGRFADFEEYTVQLAEKRTEVYEAFEAKKLNLVEARNRRASAMATSADRILKVIKNRVEGMKSISEINGYMASDLMIDKVRSIIAELIELEDTVKADDVQSRLKSIQQDAVRQLKDKLELFADGDNLIQLGKHRFTVNVQPLDLTVVRREDDMCLHLTGTRYFSSITDETFLSTRAAWSQEVVSENAGVYRSEYLAWLIFQRLRSKDASDATGDGDSKEDSAKAPSSIAEFLDLDESKRADFAQRFMSTRYAEAYTKGIHDQDAARILDPLCRIHAALDLARYHPSARACAMVFWNRFLESDKRKLWSAKLEGFGTRSRHFPGIDSHEGYVARLADLVRGFVDATGLFEASAAEDAAEYLFCQISSGKPFAISHEAAKLIESFNEALLAGHSHGDFDAARKAVSGDAASEFELISDWLRGFLKSGSQTDGLRVLAEAAAILFCDCFDPRAVIEEGTSATVKGLRGTHRVIHDGSLQFDYLEFRDRLRVFERETVAAFERFHAVKKRLIDRERQDLRLEEFRPRVLTSFVRNRLIDSVYLPMLGDNLAKQIGSAGDKKRTDLMGLLLLISPPGYGKTTLMEYVANRLGVVFMKINGPALGHNVTSLDPADAPNAAAREEVAKLNLALEMGDNVMLYLDDIQHCHPEFLQKFISLCDAQRKIEGVFRGRSRTYDLRGRKVIVVMAGNPYTESGEKFKIPDMLANRADTYNLGDILGGHEDAFKMSYIENAVTSNAVLQPLSNKSQKDIQQFIRIAETGSRDNINFEANYAAEEISEIVSVMSKLLRVRDVVLRVNLEYIRSAAQADAYRTEPPFKLQGSYRNMNRMAEKVVPIMNDAEVDALVIDHYRSESQTLTTGAEANLLKFKELLDIQTADEEARWLEIKKTFKRNLLVGGYGTDPVGRVVTQLAVFGEGLSAIRETLQTAVSTRGEQKPPEIRPEIKLDLKPIAEQVATFSKGLDGLREAVSKGLVANAGSKDSVAKAEVQQISTRIETVNADLNEIRSLIESYRNEQSAARAAAEKDIEERALDFSGITVTRDTLNKIYSLIEQDDKANGKKTFKPPKAKMPKEAG